MKIEIDKEESDSSIILADMDDDPGADFNMTGVLLEVYQETFSQLLKRMSTDTKCRNCLAINPRLKREGATKIFVQPLSPSQRKKNLEKNKVIVSPLSQLPLGSSSKLDYLTPLDVMEFLKTLWKKVCTVGLLFFKTVNVVWSSSTSLRC